MASQRQAQEQIRLPAPSLPAIEQLVGGAIESVCLRAWVENPFLVEPIPHTRQLREFSQLVLRQCADQALHRLKVSDRSPHNFISSQSALTRARSGTLTPFATNHASSHAGAQTSRV